MTTDDGYLLDLHRLPRPQSKQAAFFVHGVMDTALGWVNTSVTHSLAFSAFNRGFDVWLATCRNNPPRKHSDAAKEKRTFDYFAYTVNDLAEQDLRAQVRACAATMCHAAFPRKAHDAMAVSSAGCRTSLNVVRYFVIDRHILMIAHARCRLGSRCVNLQYCTAQRVQAKCHIKGCADNLHPPAQVY